MRRPREPLRRITDQNDRTSFVTFAASVFFRNFFSDSPRCSCGTSQYSSQVIHKIHVVFIDGLRPLHVVKIKSSCRHVTAGRKRWCLPGDKYTSLPFRSSVIWHSAGTRKIYSHISHLFPVSVCAKPKTGVKRSDLLHIGFQWLLLNPHPWRLSFRKYQKLLPGRFSSP